MARTISVPSIMGIDADRDCYCGSGRRFGTCCGNTSQDRSPPHDLIVIPRAHDSMDCEHILGSIGGTALTAHDSNPAPAGATQATAQFVQRAVQRADTSAVQMQLDQFIEQTSEIVSHAFRRKKFSHLEPASILVYPQGGGYGTHADNEVYNPEKDRWERSARRDVSIFVYLNDDYQGGILEFPLFQFSIKPQQGDLIAFPSDHRYFHTVSAVTQGHRCVLASWGVWDTASH